jgi:hypothetical protein
MSIDGASYPRSYPVLFIGLFRLTPQNKMERRNTLPSRAYIASSRQTHEITRKETSDTFIAAVGILAGTGVSKLEVEDIY